MNKYEIKTNRHKVTYQIAIKFAYFARVVDSITIPYYTFFLMEAVLLVTNAKNI